MLRVIVCMAFAMITLLAPAQVQAQSTTNELAGYWPLDSNRGSTLYDHSSTSNHGSFVQGSPSWVPGKFGNGLDIYLTTLDRATIPYSATWNTSNTWSIAFWIYPISTYRKNNIFNKGENKVALGHSAGGPTLLWPHFGSHGPHLILEWD